METIGCGNCGNQAGLYHRFCTTCGCEMPGGRERAVRRPPPPPEPPPPLLLPLVCLGCEHEITPQQAFEPRFGFFSGLREDPPLSPPDRDPRAGSPSLSLGTNELEDPVTSARRENAERVYSNAWPKRPGYFLKALWLLPCPACGAEDPMRIAITRTKGGSDGPDAEPLARDQ